MKKTKLLVEVRGKTREDLVIALEDIIKSIREGNLSGYDSNDDGEYSFDITGEIE